MKRFEAMINVKSTISNKDYSAALCEFYGAFTLSGSDKTVAEDVLFYDLGIYDYEDNGDFTIKVLLDSDRTAEEIATAIRFGFNTDTVSECTLSQLQLAH